MGVKVLSQESDLRTMITGQPTLEIFTDYI